MRASILLALLVPPLFGCAANVVDTAVASSQGTGPSVVEARLERKAFLLQQYGNTRLEVDASGRITWMEVDLEGGVTERYEFDAQGRPVFWRQDAPGEADDVTEVYAFDDGGRPVRWVHDEAGEENDVEETYAYDARSRLASITHGRPGAAADFVERYAYDDAGRLVRFEREVRGSELVYVETYQYDASGALIGVGG